MPDETNPTQAADPAADRATGADVLCARGHVNAAGATRCVSCQQWLPRNTGAQVHGVTTLDRRGPSSLPADLRETYEVFQAEVYADLGGIANITALEREAVQNVVRAALVCTLAAQEIAAHGMTTPRGRQRAVVHILASYIDRFERLAKTLGLQRRARVVGESIEQWLEAQPEVPVASETEAE